MNPFATKKLRKSKKQTYVNKKLSMLRFIVMAILNIDLQAFLSENVNKEMKPNQLLGPRNHLASTHWNLICEVSTTVPYYVCHDSLCHVGRTVEDRRQI
jgi:hypothetical protein